MVVIVGMSEAIKECGAVLTAGGFEPPIPKDGEVPVALKTLATKDAGPPIPRLTAAQLQALTGGNDPSFMPLPDRNPMR